MLEFFSRGPWVFSKTLKFWRFKVSLKKWFLKCSKNVFGGKLVENAPNVAFFGGLFGEIFNATFGKWEWENERSPFAQVHFSKRQRNMLLKGWGVWAKSLQNLKFVRFKKTQSMAVSASSSGGHYAFCVDPGSQKLRREKSKSSSIN